MRSLLTVIACLAIITIPPTAYAFEPAPGTRAYPLTGRDMISGRTVDLEEHLGQWVLLTFWSSW